MGAFDVLRIAGTSLGMHQTWLDTLAYNIANVNTVTPTSESAFQAQMRRSPRPSPGGGVEVAGIAPGRPEGRSTTSPTTRWPTPTATSARPTSTWPAR